MRTSDTPCPGGHQLDSNVQCPDFQCQNLYGDCENGGSCNNGICDCPFGFLGRDCTLIPSKIKMRDI